MKKNKRSASLALILMGSLTMSGVAGCSDDPQAADDFKVVKSVQECVQVGDYTEAQCKELIADASKDRPNFATKALCEEQYGAGNCEQQAVSSGSGGGSSFMPLMAGFMLGRFLSGGNRMQSGQALYRQPGGDNSSFRTANGASVKPDASGRVQNLDSRLRQGAMTNAKPAVGRTNTSTRGGFSGSNNFGGSSGS